MYNATTKIKDKLQYLTVEHCDLHGTGTKGRFGQSSDLIILAARGGNNTIRNHNHGPAHVWAPSYSLEMDARNSAQ